MAAARGVVKRSPAALLSEVDRHAQADEGGPDQRVSRVGDRRAGDDIRRGEHEQRRRPGIAGYPKLYLSPLPPLRIAERGTEGVRSGRRGAVPRSIDEETGPGEPEKNPVPEHDLVEQLAIRSRCR